MSIKVMSKVWESNLEANQKLLCLCLADFGNDDGENIFPSVSVIAKRTTVSERTAQRILHNLVVIGIINQVGKTTSGTFKYRINISVLESYRGDKLSPPENNTKIPEMSPQGCQIVTGGVTTTTLRGDRAMSPDPLINQVLNHQLTKDSDFSKKFDFIQILPEIRSETFMQAENVWRAIYGQLKMDMSRGAFDTWVKAATTAGYTKIGDGYVLSVFVPTEFARDWIDKRLKPTIGRILAGITNGVVSDVLIIQGELAEAVPA